MIAADRFRRTQHVRPRSLDTLSGIGDPTHLNCALGNTVNVALDRLVKLIEKLTLPREIGIRSVPISMFALQLQIYSICETIIAELDECATGALREVFTHRTHFDSSKEFRNITA